MAGIQHLLEQPAEMLSLALPLALAASATAATVDMKAFGPRYPPQSSKYSSIADVLNATGSPGIYDSSVTPDSQYGTYNWCNMPHVRGELPSSWCHDMTSAHTRLCLAQPMSTPCLTLSTAWSMSRSYIDTTSGLPTPATFFPRRISLGTVYPMVLSLTLGMLLD